MVDRDNNVLVCGSNNGNQPFLIRIRPNLQIDTMLFLPAVYDSLCSYQITDGFIPYDTTTVGMEEVYLNNEGFYISPNPATTHLTLQYSPPKTAGVATVFNSTGSKVSEIIIPKNSLSLQLDISQYPSGLYLLKIETESYSGTKKFIKY
jgi:hypothetical protein